MKKLILATSGAALIALSASLPANALSVVVSNIADSQGYLAGDTGANAPAMLPNLATLKAAMSSNAEAVARIKALGSDGDVQVVRVGALTGGDNSGFDKSMTADKMAIDALRTAIGGNANLSGALKKQNIALDSVVAAKLDVAGHLVIYSNT